MDDTMQPGRKSLLIIDDSPEDRQIYRYLLEDEYQVMETGLGRQGLSMIRELRPDCVLLDYSLPDMDGLRILKALNADPTLVHIPVILLTGHGDVSVAVSAMRSGALDFLEKSVISVTALKRALANATEKARLRRKVERQREWLRATLASIHHGVLAVDREARVVVMNATAACLTGWRPEDAIGQRLADLLALRDDEPRFDWRDHLPDAPAACDMGGDLRSGILSCRDGRTFPVEYNLIATHDPAGNVEGLVLSIQDVTAHRQTEATLIKAKQAAEQANQAKSRFLANMSHELRTPLNAVLGLAQLLELGQLEPDQREMVGQIRGGGLALLNLINDLLDYGTLESGELRIEPAHFHLDQILTQLTRLLGGMARDKGLTLRAGKSPGLDGPWLGDALRLGQILMNLTSNAIKFTERGEIAVSISGPPAGGLRFEVRDTGIGIRPELLGGLFRPFTQADSSITRRFGGTGLGLAICKQLVERMGGRMGAESTPEAGSLFWFEVPLQRSRGSQDAPARARADDTGAPRLRGLKVLVVDDSQVNRYLAEQALKREGARSQPARDGQEALTVLRERPCDFDAVLMDIQMPVLDGLTATRALRRQPATRDLPIIAVTAGIQDEDRQAALEAGVNAFLSKPIELDFLVETLSRLCQVR